jgi:Helix-turn-helix domain
MKPSPNQFRVRENPASLRQHGSCHVVQSTPNQPTQAADGTATGGEDWDENQLLTVREVATLLRVPVSWVYDRVRRNGAGQRPHIKLGKYLRFELRVVKTFIQEQRRA